MSRSLSPPLFLSRAFSLPGPCMLERVHARAGVCVCVSVCVCVCARACRCGPLSFLPLYACMILGTSARLMKLRIDLSGCFICTDSVGLGGPSGQLLVVFRQPTLDLQQIVRFVEMHPSSRPRKKGPHECVHSPPRKSRRPEPPMSRTVLTRW